MISIEKLNRIAQLCYYYKSDSITDKETWELGELLNEWKEDFDKPKAPVPLEGPI